LCQDGAVLYADVAAALTPTGMAARGGFNPGDAQPAAGIVIVGNIGGAMWPNFRLAEQPVDDPLDHWTRSVLAPIAAKLGATLLHPSDRPYQPFQRWAQQADDVWPSPLGLLVHAEYGLWHAYRGALLFPDPIEGLPPTGAVESPCVTCADQPCLQACPVNAFTGDGYDADGCRTHVRSNNDPRCSELGCAARLACPLGTEHRYGYDQMQFHMRAFVG
jgi:ferredoxin-like protein FixX